MVAAGTPHARRASLQLLTAVVQEFSPATASPLGLPWDYHERCRAALEATYLQASATPFARCLAGHEHTGK